MQFYYNMYGRSSVNGASSRNGASLKLEQIIEGDPPRTIFSTDDNQDIGWQKVKVNVGLPIGQKYSVRTLDCGNLILRIGISC